MALEYTLDENGVAGWREPVAPPSVIANEQFGGENVSVPYHQAGDLTWDNQAGDSLLDCSNLSQPAFISRGVYAVTIEVLGLSMNEGGLFTADLYGGGLLISSEFSPLASAAFDSPHLTLPVTTTFAAGDTLVLNVSNYDGVIDPQTRSFRIQKAIVQRLA